MPNFETPEPISVTIELVAGDVRITASDRSDTVVEVRASNDSADADVRVAEQTRVEYADGRLLVKAPKQRNLGLWGTPGSIDVSIALPTGSRVQGDASVARFTSVGSLGECQIKTSAGEVHLDHTGPLELTTGAGAVSVERVAGHAEVKTGSGKVRIKSIDGPAVVKNSNGDSWIGTVTGDLRVNAANGDIAVDHPEAGITAATANGDVRIGEASRGLVSIKTASGELEVGVRAGTAALLDLHTRYGNVRNHLEATEPPTHDAGSVEVRARTSFGDIVIRRCSELSA